MTTLSNTLNKASLKTHITTVQAAIQSELKVDAGKQAAYHIFAVCNFLQNDQQLKGLLKKSTYAITTNLGSAKNPCVITHTIGNFEHDHEGKWEAEMYLRSCEVQAEWNILKDGEILQVDNDYNFTLRSMPTPIKGLKMTITVEAEKYSDLVDHLDNIKDKIESEHSCGQIPLPRTMHDYTFEVFGDEYDFIEDITCLVDNNLYAVFDAKGIIESTNDEDDIISTWENRHTEIIDWSGYLIHGEFTELSSALEDDTERYHAISRDNTIIHSGDITDVLDALKEANQEFSLYRELRRD
jgi:hypothetical protein